MQDSDRPYKFADIWAINATGTLVTSPIPITTGSTAAASQSLGFPPATAVPTGAGGTPPAIWDFNGILQYGTAWDRWLQAGGAVPYDATFQTAIGGYPTGALVRKAADYSAFWRSTTNNNATDPDTGGSGWVTWPFSQTGEITGNDLVSSIALPGAPTTSTANVGDTTTKIATTAFVNQAGSSFGTPGSGQKVNSDGTIEQWFRATVSGGGGLFTNNVAYPAPFASQAIRLNICYDGTSPPDPSNPGSISIDFLDNGRCVVTTNFTLSVSLGVFITALGE